MNVTCPHCGTAYEVEKKDMYRFANCKVCGKGFVIGATTKLTVPRHVDERTCDDGSAACQRPTAHQEKGQGFFWTIVLPWLSQWQSLFTLEGIVDRPSYFKFSGINIFLYLLTYHFLFDLLGKLGFDNLYVCTFIRGLIHSAIVLSFFPVIIKRLRDANRSIHWVWLIFAIMLLTGFNLYLCLAAIILVGVLRPNGGAKQSMGQVNSKWIKVAFCAIVLGYAYVGTLYIYYWVNKAQREGERILRNLPFRNITYNRIQGDGMSSTYMFTTDAPACANCIAVYVMGSLFNVEIVRSEDPEKAEEVKKYIQENYELEGCLSRQPF